MFILLGKELKNVPPPLPSNAIFFKFTTVWDWFGFMGSWLSFFFLGLTAVFTVVNEIDYKTFRQNIITGLSRKEYFIAKIMTIFVISAAASLLYFITCFIVGAVHTTDWDFALVFDNSWATSRYFLMCLGYMSFGLMCGFLLRRAGIAVLFYICYIIMLEAILKWVVHFKFFKNSSINYYPANCIEDLMPFPLYRFADALPRQDLDFEFLLPYSHAVIGTVFWIFVFLGISYWTYTRRDL